MMNQTQIARLAAMANTLRPDWPNASIYTFLARELSNRAYRDVAVALAWVAADQDTKTPRRLLEAGPWWKSVTNPGETNTMRPPRKDEQCTTHAGQWRDSCHGCAADNLAGDQTRPAELRRPDRAAQLAEARRVLAEAKTTLCACGVDPLVCAEHKPTPITEDMAEYAAAHRTEESDHA